jgi:hypothetical protein
VGDEKIDKFHLKDNFIRKRRNWDIKSTFTWNFWKSIKAINLVHILKSNKCFRIHKNYNWIWRIFSIFLLFLGICERIEDNISFFQFVSVRTPFFREFEHQFSNWTKMNLFLKDWIRWSFFVEGSPIWRYKLSIIFKLSVHQK